MDLQYLWDKSKQYGVQQIESEFKQLLEIIPEGSTGIEIGCYSGGTTIAFSLLCKKLISVDIRKIFDTSEAESNCNYAFFEGSSYDDNTVIDVKHHLDGELVDFLFIDGDHTAEGCMKDFNCYSELVKKGGLIIFHDIVDTIEHRNQNCYVAYTWNTLKATYKHYEFIEGRTWGGIGVLINE